MDIAPRPVSRRKVLALIGTAGLGTVLTACGTSNGSAASRASTTGTTGTTGTTTGPGTGAGSSSTATATSPAAALTGCVLTAEQEQGPYYYPAAKVRSNITDGRPGIPMRLEITVVDVHTCAPIPDAAVDVWHADALGAYSDSGDGLFLRGIQSTAATGVAAFQSIYPGWYPSRTNHVHVKVHHGGNTSDTYAGGHVSHTGNLFFPEDTSVAVAALAPYTGNAARRTPLASDFVYRGQNGAGSVMTLREVTPGSPDTGYVASMVVAVDPAATPALIGIAGTVG